MTKGQGGQYKCFWNTFKQLQENQPFFVHSFFEASEFTEIWFPPKALTQTFFNKLPPPFPYVANTSKILLPGVANCGVSTNMNMTVISLRIFEKNYFLFFRRIIITFSHLFLSIVWRGSLTPHKSQWRGPHLFFHLFSFALAGLFMCVCLKLTSKIDISKRKLLNMKFLETS